MDSWCIRGLLYMVSGGGASGKAGDVRMSFYKVQGLAKRWSPGCVNAAGKAR